MALLKTLFGSLLYGLRDMLIMVFIIGAFLGLLTLVFSSPWALGIALLIVVLVTGYGSYKERK